MALKHEDLNEILAQETQLCLSRFTHSDGIERGLWLLERAREMDASVAIEV